MKKRRNCGQDVIEKWVNVRASLRNEKRFSVDYPKIYKILFQLDIQFFCTYMCIRQGKKHEMNINCYHYLLSRTRCQAVSSEEVIDMRALNRLIKC